MIFIIAIVKCDQSRTIVYINDSEILQNVKICNGMTYTDGKFRQTYRQVYKFIDNQIPSALTPELIKKEEVYAFTEDVHTMQCSGVTSGSVSLNTPWLTAEANFNFAKENSKAAGKVLSYNTFRYLIQKRAFSAAEDQLEISDQFYDVIKRAVSARRDVDKYYKLVEALNQWGWYVPLEYVVGGAVYSTKTSQVTTEKESEKESREIGAKFELTYMKMASVGAGVSNTQSHGNSASQDEKKETMTLLQIGGNVCGQDNFNGWLESLQSDPKSWGLIAFKRFSESLMLLYDKDLDMWNKCLRLLSKYYDNAAMKDLQPFINIRDYHNAIKFKVYSFV